MSVICKFGKCVSGFRFGKGRGSEKFDVILELCRHSKLVLHKHEFMLKHVTPKRVAIKHLSF